MRSTVTLDEMREAVQSLHLILPKFGLTPDTMPHVIRLYREALDPYDGEAVRGAAAMLVKTADRFPAPAKWREACATWVRHNRISIEWTGEQDAAGNDIACRICRAVPRWARLRYESTPFSAPVRLNGEPPAPELVRRIVVCDPSRHHTPHGISAAPANFIAWA